MMLAALAFAHAMQLSPAAIAAAGPWPDVRAGQTQQWNGRSVTLSGTILAYRIGSVLLLPEPPRRTAQGGWDFDATACVGLMVSPAQFRMLRSGRPAIVSGTFLSIDLARGGGATTSVSRRGRRAYPNCASAPSSRHSSTSIRSGFIARLAVGHLPGGPPTICKERQAQSRPSMWVKRSRGSGR
jgi:hypothetical protein